MVQANPFNFHMLVACSGLAHPQPETGELGPLGALACASSSFNMILALALFFAMQQLGFTQSSLELASIETNVFWGGVM